MMKTKYKNEKLELAILLVENMNKISDKYTELLQEEKDLCGFNLLDSPLLNLRQAQASRLVAMYMREDTLNFLKEDGKIHGVILELLAQSPLFIYGHDGFCSFGPTVINK